MHSYKREPQTLAQKLGFQDPDRRSPQHDEIVLWVTQHADYVLTQIHGQPAWTSELRASVHKRAEEVRAYLEANRPEELEGFQRFMADAKLPKPMRSIFRIDLESPIQKPTYRGGGGYVVGFADVVIHWQFNTLSLAQEYETRTGMFRPSSSSTWPTPRHGWHEALWREFIEARGTHIEVKTKIESFGDLLRQINLYREFQPAPWCVVSPDGRYADILRSQGVALVIPG